MADIRKIIFIIIPVLLLGLLIFLTFQYINRDKKGALQVTSSPAGKVYLDGAYLGQTPLCRCPRDNNMIKTGNYTLRLVPVDKSFSEYQEKITISDSVYTVVDIKFGKESLSEGSVISLSPLADKKQTELIVLSFPKGASVLLDNNVIGTTPLRYENPTNSDHVLKVRKEGYKEKTLLINSPLGFQLTAVNYLSTNVTEDKTETLSASPSALPSPTPSQSVRKVVILETPNGFLRVRASGSLAAAEITRVSPGESFQLLNEENGWFEIKLADGTSGWISSQFARIQ